MNYTSNVDTHKANEYLELCNDAENAFYHIKRGKMTDYKTSNGYTAVEIGDKTSWKESNFKAVLFQKGDEYVVTFFGTDIASPKDIYADAQMVIKNMPKQFEDAEKFTETIIDNFAISKDKLTVVGHSEGGAEAIHVKAVLGLPQAYTFNPFIPDTSKYPQESLQNIYNFRTPEDIISKCGHSAGEDFIVPLKDGLKPRKGPKYVSDTHRLDHIGDCRDAKSVEEYRFEDKNFVDKYTKQRLTMQDIDVIPPEIYGLFEKEIMFSILTNGFDESGEHNNCVGSYYVSGYTRDDGKKVSGYHRRCGAKHDNL